MSMFKQISSALRHGPSIFLLKREGGSLSLNALDKTSETLPDTYNSSLWQFRTFKVCKLGHVTSIA